MQVIDALKRHRTAYVSIDLSTTSGIALVGLPVVIRDQFGAVGTLTTTAGGFASGQYSVKIANSYTFTASFAGNSTYGASTVSETVP